MNKKRRLILEYFVIVFGMIIVFLIFGGFFMQRSADTKQVNNTVQESSKSSKPIANKVNKEEETIVKQQQYKNINFAVFGVDIEENLTDVMFVVNFDTKTKNINLMSLPRDTRVKIADIRANEIRNRGRYLPSDGVVKLNQVHSYAGREKGIEYSTKQIEELLGITIDYYAKMNLAGFKNIVDAIDGVEINVPEKMDYEDPVQGLYIHLDKGQQHLNGKAAEQLVRYRGYAQADLMRVSVQQMFIKEFMSKILNKDNLISNAPAIAYNILKYVNTDFTIEDALEYIQYIEDIELEKVNMMVLPGQASTIDKVSYYIYDEAETKKLVNQYFTNTN